MATESKRRIVAEFAATNKAKGAIAGFSRDLTGAVSSVRRLMGATLALAGVGGLGYLIKQQMAAIDANAKLSDRLDISTQSLIALQHAAKISGVENEALNKALEIFSRRLGEVNMGVGQAKYALDSLGLSADALADKSPDEAIGIIADQINRLPSAAQKAAAANYLFGRSGQQLLNLFEEGSAGIDKYRAEVERLGLSYDRVDAAKVEAANDAMTRLKTTLTGKVQDAVIALAPHLEALAKSLTDSMAAGDGFGKAMAKAAENAAIGVVVLITEIRNLIALMKHLKEAGPNAVTVAALQMDAAAYRSNIAKYEKQAREGWFAGVREEAQKNAEEQRRKLAYVQQQIADEIANNVYTPLDTTSGVDAVKDYFDKLDTAATEIEINIRNRRKRRRAGASLPAEEGPGAAAATSAKTDPTAQYFAELDREMDLMRTPSMDSIQVRRERAIKLAQMENIIQKEKIEGGAQILAQYEAQLVKLQRLQELEVMARGVGDAFGDAMEQFITGAKSAEEAIKDLVREIALLVLRQAVIQPISNAISSGIMSAAMMHDGGTVGRDGTPVLADASLFTHAPSFKQGRKLGSDEFAAILHQDEEVIPAGQQAGGTQVNVGIYAEKSLLDDWLVSAPGTASMIRWMHRNQASIR